MVRIIDLSVHFELQNLLQIFDSQVLRNVESVVQIFEVPLLLSNAVIDALDDYGEEAWMLKAEVLILNLALDK